MSVKPLLQENYKTVKDIFQEAFGPQGYICEDIGYAWRKRILGMSQGYFNDDGDLLGFAIVNKRNPTKAPYLHFFAVYENYKSLGYGSKIIKAVLDKAPNVYLWPEGASEEDTEALKRWYEKNGFRLSSDNFYVIHAYNTRSKPKLLPKPTTRP